MSVLALDIQSLEEDVINYYATSLAVALRGHLISTKRSSDKCDRYLKEIFNIHQDSLLVHTTMSYEDFASRYETHYALKTFPLEAITQPTISPHFSGRQNADLLSSQ